MRFHLVRTMIAFLCFAAVSACNPLETSRSDRAQTLTVYAAASLQATFSGIGAEFEDSHPGTKIRFNFAGSSDLVAQLGQGAPADVLATADEFNMSKAVDAGLVLEPRTTFAENTLQIVVAPGNPMKITQFSDLQREDVDLVVCAPQVPCGSATQAVSEAISVDLDPVSEEQSVTDVLGKVLSGQADAGIVYVTDVNTAGKKVEGIPFPEAKFAPNKYQIAVSRSTKHPELAADFIAFVVSRKGHKVLQEAGFDLP